MAIISEKNAMELNKMLKADDGSSITKRYIIIHYKGNYEFFDNSLNEVVFTGNKKDMETFIKGFICGRTTSN